MSKITVKWIIQTSIVTAFTIAVALIWKDVFDELMQFLIPSGTKLFSKFIAAIIATLIAIVAIYLILEAESETESVFRKLKKRLR